MKSRFAIAAILGAVLMMAGLSSASAAVTLVVDDDGQASATNCNGVAMAFTTIQSAVTAAASGDTVKVCPGTYAENVSVDKTLTLKGAKAGVDARTRGTSGESIVDPPANALPGLNLLADNITVDGFTVSGTDGGPGIQTSGLFSGYDILNNIIRDNVFGLYAHNDGDAQMVVSKNRFRDNNVAGSAAGNGIYSDQGAQGILIKSNRFQGHVNAGVLFADAGVDNDQLIVSSNQSTNNSSFVSIFDGTNIQVVFNNSNDTIGGDDGVQGSAIFIGAGFGVLVQGNTLTNPAFSGVAVRNSPFTGDSSENIDLLGNTIKNAENHGIDVTADSSGVAQIRNNKTLNSVEDGIFMGAATNGNNLRGNTAKNNDNFDCEDDSTGTNTAGTANFWFNNVGPQDSPNGICKN